MSQPTRPLPGLDEPDTREFWVATKNHELRYQTCEACSSVVFHPRSHCTTCLSGRLRWNVSRGEGTIYTWSAVRQSYHPFFRARVPYAVAWIDLDEGFRMLSNVVGVADPARDLRIGQRVRLTWEDCEEVAIPLFEPIGS
jgi:uncharacterized OB-fold protein